MISLRSRRIELQSQFNTAKDKLAEAERIAQQLKIGCIQLQAKLDEIDFLMNVGRILGFGREFAKVLIRWASEGIIWRNKMHKIIDSGVELHPEYIT